MVANNTAAALMAISLAGCNLLQLATGGQLSGGSTEGSSGDLGSDPDPDYRDPNNSTSRFIALDDYNNDGFLDLFVAAYDTGRVVIWKGAGDGTFESGFYGDLAIKSVSLRSQMSPVRVQGKRQTCSAFATVALLEFFHPGYDFSEQCLVKLSHNEKFSNRDYGSANHRLKFALKSGLYQEADCGYDPSVNGFDDYINIAGKTPVQLDDQFTYYEMGELANPIEVIKFHLQRGSPVITQAYEAGVGWKNGRILYTPTDYEIETGCKNLTIDSSAPDNLARCAIHFFVVTGYDDDKKILEFKNSWGAGWGHEGYGYMSYGYYMKMHGNELMSK